MRRRRQARRGWHDRSGGALPLGCAPPAEVRRLWVGWFWSSSPNANNSNNAWNVNFNNGNVNNNNKDNAKYVRLVRGGK
ncbi:MAG: DUF1566 domain-containing protein [Chromatiaceae bacterium]|nr:DUF1566 domain-containing protein [Chromatiaceae bacterium]MBP6807888.1 DUF1566 domain-containing protein [Chromatiaceae bacterium]MBP8289318.1 DUF1566 domain-containing protein [Chromatiaceae bacterium]MBP9755016.1 DUF1566 domain-containing protein [Phenylobacterium sp.]